MAKLEKDTLAINIETDCRLRVTKACNKEIGDPIKLSNGLEYIVKEIHQDKIFVQYA